jgi:hypothetical protein
LAVLVAALVTGAFTVGRNFEAFFGPEPDPCAGVAEAAVRLTEKVEFATDSDEEELALRASLIHLVNNAECVGPVSAAEAQAMLDTLDAE